MSSLHGLPLLQDKVRQLAFRSLPTRTATTLIVPSWYASAPTLLLGDLTSKQPYLCNISCEYKSMNIVSKLIMYNWMLGWFGWLSAECEGYQSSNGVVAGADGAYYYSRYVIAVTCSVYFSSGVVSRHFPIIIIASPPWSSTLTLPTPPSLLSWYNTLFLVISAVTFLIHYYTAGYNGGR